MRAGFSYPPPRLSHRGLLKKPHPTLILSRRACAPYRGSIATNAEAIAGQEGECAPRQTRASPSIQTAPFQVAFDLRRPTQGEGVLGNSVIKQDERLTRPMRECQRRPLPKPGFQRPPQKAVSARSLFIPLKIRIRRREHVDVPPRLRGLPRHAGCPPERSSRLPPERLCNPRLPSGTSAFPRIMWVI